MIRTLKYLTCLVAALAFVTALAQPNLQAETVAHVYVTTSHGTYAYDASSTGALKPIPGSPFATAGSQVGTNGKYFVTVDSSHFYNYGIASNGGILNLSEVDSLPTSQCGAISGGVFDHSGVDIYISRTGATADGGLEGVCDGVQTVTVGSHGATYKGDTTFENGDRFASTDTLPKLSGNDKFAYNTSPVGDSCQVQINAFARESTGVLNSVGFTETDPEPNTKDYSGYLPTSFITDDPTDHLAIVVYPTRDGPCGPTGAYQLASYTINSHGDIASTNTWEKMPTLASSDVYDIKLDPTGKYLAVATGTGVQFFHFNGASPITSFTGVIGTSGYITQMAWDSSGHLYAQNGSSGKMHVYEVSSSGVKEALDSGTVVPIAPFTVRAE